MGLFESKPAVKAGEMVYAWTTEDKIAQKAECGGAVTGLLKYARANKMVDAVRAVQKGQGARTQRPKPRPDWLG